MPRDHRPIDDPAPPPLPVGWPRVRRNTLIVITAVFLALLSVGMLIGAAGELISGDPGTAVLLVAGALLLAHVAGLGLLLSRHPRRGGPPPGTGTDDRGNPGLAFSYAGEPYYWLLAVLLLSIVGGLGLAAILTLSGSPVGWTAAVLVAAGAGYTTWLGIGIARLAPGRLVLTPDGVHHRALTLDVFTPWYAIHAVEAADTDQPMIVIKAQPSDGTRLRTYAGRGGHEAQFLPYVAVRALWLRRNSIGAYQALDHYLRHPDQRSHLGTPAAVDHLRRLDRHPL